MMKNKFKIFLLIISILLIFIVNKQNVYANTLYSSYVSFDYVCTYTVNQQSKVIKEEQNVFEASIYDSRGKEDNLKIIIYTDTSIINNKLNNKSYINNTNISIEVVTNYENYTLYLYDSFNNEIASTGNKILQLNDLVDDTYNFKAFLDGAGNLIDNRTYEKFSTECSFTFTVDTTPPIIKGASLNMNGVYTNTSFEIIGYDEGSGVEAVYMLEPNGTKYQNIGTSIELSSSKEGLISFYAIDKIGNRSMLYYIYNDITKPTCFIKDENNQIINQDYTQESFYYQAKDSGSGISYMEYKTPSSSTFIIYESNIIYNYYEEGLYEFRSIDKAGNISDVTKIYLYQTNSIVKIVNIPNSNKVYLTWDDNEFNVLINNTNYIKNTIIEDEGQYLVTIEDKAGIISYINFDINCYYTFIEKIKPTCKEQGYTLYKCISCEKQLKTDYQNIINIHNYSLEYIEPSCLQEGGIVNKCVDCNYMFYINKQNPINHKLQSDIFSFPTCLDEGLRVKSCMFCAYEQSEVIPKLNHHFIIIDEIKENNNIIKILLCKNCNTQEVITINTKSTQIMTAINTILTSYYKYVFKILIITSSIWSVIIGIRIIISTKTEEVKVVKQMIKNYIVGLVIIFIILAIIPSLISGMINIILS